MTVDELQRKYPSIPWVEYINTLLDIPDIKIGVDERVIVSVPKYIGDLETLLSNTPKRYDLDNNIKIVIFEFINFLE